MVVRDTTAVTLGKAVVGGGSVALARPGLKRHNVWTSMVAARGSRRRLM
jgi:hypothetical protein